MNDQDSARLQGEVFQLRQEIRNLSFNGTANQSNPPLERAAYNISISIQEMAKQFKLAFLWGCAILTFGIAGILALILVILGGFS